MTNRSHQLRRGRRENHPRHRYTGPVAIPETPTNPLITGETTTPGAYQSPLLTTLHGAADAPDGHPSRGVAWHYGNPLGEQRAFERSAGVVDRSHQRVLRITGDDALTWLNSLISQKVDALMPGMTTHGLILDAKGHIEHAVTIVRPRGDAPDTDDRQRPEESHAESGNQPLLYLICTPEHVDALRTYLTQMVFWSHVTVEDADVALITIMGPDTSAIINQITLEPHHWCHNTITFHDHVIGDNDSIHLLVPTAALKDTFTALTNAGATPTGLMAYEAERIKAVIPDVALDLDGRTVPHEVEAFIGPHASGPTQLATANEGPSASYVHLNKGCYRGQETVSRIHNLGRRRDYWLSFISTATPVTAPPLAMPSPRAGALLDASAPSLMTATKDPSHSAWLSEPSSRKH